jgi:rhodanese-related sulfurtransferase
MRFTVCTPAELREAIASGEGQAIDVREPAEVAAERIEGLVPLPLTSFDRGAERLRTDQPVYVVCRSGRRAAAAGERLKALGHQDVRILQDGLIGWAAAGYPVEKGASRVWSLERQVRFVAGSLVLAGVLLAAFVHPWFVALSGFVGAGLVFSAVTDTCGMALVLARMPWNQRAGVACAVPETR